MEVGERWHVEPRSRMESMYVTITDIIPMMPGTLVKGLSSLGNVVTFYFKNHAPCDSFWDRE